MKVSDVMTRDVVTLPEFIQAQFSQGDLVKGRRFGSLRAVKTLKKQYKRPGTDFSTEHLMDLGASLPIAVSRTARNFGPVRSLRGSTDVICGIGATAPRVRPQDKPP